MKLNNCPGCLKPGFDTYCSNCRKSLFKGRKVNHVLNFTRAEFNIAKREQSGRFSISGIQIKHSLCMNNKELNLCTSNGEYILKPVPVELYKQVDQVPANEHLTMQIAKQVYKINTAENGMIFFADGEPAYITKRFDVNNDGTRRLQEDFAQIAGKTKETNGDNYKYEFSYEALAEYTKKYVTAYPVEIEKLFVVILFNYLFSNGDAHIKNFSLFRNEEYGDYLFTPFYDLMNTSIHAPGGKNTALKLFKNNYASGTNKTGNKYTKKVFLEFAGVIGINEKRFEFIYDRILSGEDKVKSLIEKSFLKDEVKEKYLNAFLPRYQKIIR